MQLSVSRLLLLFSVFLTIALPSLAQVPTGGLRGTVTDPSKAVIKGATVTIKNTATGVERKVETDSDGDFISINLLPGEYEIKVSAQGFKAQVTTATVVVGSTLTNEFILEIGNQNETVVISGDTSAAINTTDFKIDGVITRQKIDSLPLNGRNFLQLASLEPGVRVSTSNPGDANNLFNVSIGGASSALTRLTVDGGSVVDYVTGGAGQNFSVETIQEFQISTFNFDLATGVTSVGAVNIVSRTGSNDYHGSAFVFYRDNNIAAYPVLNRDPKNPDPFFRRLQTGFAIGGPIKKDKLFWFFNLEDLNQDTVFSTVNQGYRIPGTNVFPLSQFDTTTGSPYDQFLTNARVDYLINPRHSIFVRYSHDDSKAFAPVEGNVLPSNWRVNKNNSDMAQGGWTWVPSSRWTNDLRFNWHYVGNKSLIPTAGDCPNCLGLGGAQIRINNSSFRLGNQIQAPQNRALHRYETVNNTSYLRGNHFVQFGGTWEKDYGVGSWNFLAPAVMVLHDPNDVITVNGTIDFLVAAGQLPAAVAPALKIPLPASFTTPGATITLNDILQLPIAGAAVGIGDGAQPPPFNAEKARRSQRFRFYAQDTWKIVPRFTLKYGVSYVYETNLFNHDLRKPSLLQPFYGTTDPNKRDKDNFAPSIGFNWDVRGNGKTVIRGGASMFYDTSLFVNRLTERALIGPLGNGRVQTTGDFFRNTIVFPQIPGLPLPLSLINPALGTPINFQVIPTKFTGANFLTTINQQIPLIQAQLNALGNAGFAGLDFFKTASGNGIVIDPNSKIPYSLQYSVGLQRELPYNMLLSADFVLRQRVHTFFTADRNLFNRAASLGGSVVRRCANAAEATNPAVRCTNGPVELFEGSGREKYKALLVKVDKRFSNRYQFTGSYALSSNTGFDYTRDLTNLYGNPGPLGSDARHIFTFSGIVDLPWGFQAGLITSFASRPPFSATLPGTANSDLNGDGTNNDLLPGFGYNRGNRPITEAEMRARVFQYNQDYAARIAPRGGLTPYLRFPGEPDCRDNVNIPASVRGTVPCVLLPANFQFGDVFQTWDVRLSKNIKFTERLQLEVIGEAFNLFNTSNLGGFSGRLDGNFGQASSKVGQAFGSGGPRAFEFAARLKF